MSSSDEDGEHFVELFKKEHNEQFYVLVKMHLSFLLNMTTEECEYINDKGKFKKWNIMPFGKKMKQKSLNEGTCITNEILEQLHQLINYIKQEKNLKSEGIFRRTGSIERQNELRNLLYQNQTILFEQNSYTVHDCASVLKGLLSDLPESITTDSQFPIYCQIVESYQLNDTSHQSKVLQCLQLLYLLLPAENRSLLKDIFSLLHEVTKYVEINKMSSENLAKLFTPHLLCPRKLPPETLLKDSQALFGIVAFMIKRYPELFKVPGQLMLDFRLHYDQTNILNESIKGAAHTVFTFVDNKLTAKENQENVTETALAQLYAHIQSLPESSKKRKLVKQFNKENGQGTPLQVLRSSMPKNKSFGDSIKKHMFHKKLIKNMKRSGLSQLKNATSEEILNETMMTPRSRKPVLLVSGTNINNLAKLTPNPTNLRVRETFLNTTEQMENVKTRICSSTTNNQPFIKSEQNLLVSETSTILSEVNSDQVHKNKTKNNFTKSKSDGELSFNQNTLKIPKLNRTDSPKSLSTTFRQYLNSRNIIADESLSDSSFTSRSDDFQSYTELHNEISYSFKEESKRVNEDFGDEKISDSMLYILDGNHPEQYDGGGKEPVLKPRQFDEDGKPIVFETSF